MKIVDDSNKKYFICHGRSCILHTIKSTPFKKKTGICFIPYLQICYLNLTKFA